MPCGRLPASEPVILLFAQRDDGEASLADQRGALKQLTGFYLCQSYRMGDELPRLDPDLGDLGVSGINRLDGGRSHCALFIARVIDHQLVAFLHVAQILHRHGIGYAVPDGGLLFLQVGKAVDGGFGLEKVVGHVFILSAVNCAPQAL